MAKKPALAVSKDDPIPSLGGKPLAPSGEVVETFDCEQGSDEWIRLRLGLCTASNFSTIMASGKDGGESIGRRKLLHQLAGEILTGEPAETFTSKAMDRGKEMEPEACEHYAFTRQVELTQVGFVVRTLARGRKVGGSPDRFVSNDGILETKTMRPDLMIDLALKGAQGFPSEHRAQAHGLLWVTGRQWCDLMIFYRRMPVAPTFRIERDEVFIQQIADAVEVFDYDLRKLVERIRNMAK